MNSRYSVPLRLEKNRSRSQHKQTNMPEHACACACWFILERKKNERELPICSWLRSLTMLF